MGKRLLIAVDDTDASRRAIRYVAYLAGMIDQLRCQLLFVLPAESSAKADPAGSEPKTHRDDDHLSAVPDGSAKVILEQGRDILQKKGALVEGIETIQRLPKEGVAEAILDYGLQNRMSAVVAGRRRRSTLKKTFLGSVSADLVEQSTCLPVWIVGSEPPNDRFLVPVDGSESALRAVDHLSQIFKDHSDTVFQFLHIVPRLGESCAIDYGPESSRLERLGLRGVHHCIDNFCAKAALLFQSAGLRENQIDIKVGQGLFHPGKAIVAEIRRGGFRTVIIGRRGMRRSLATGSVSRYVITKSDPITLWLVP